MDTSKLETNTQKIERLEAELAQARQREAEYKEGFKESSRNFRSLLEDTGRLIEEREQLRADLKTALEAMRLVDLMFKRQDPERLGDDEHEAWTAITAAVAPARTDCTDVRSGGYQCRPESI